MAATPDGKGYWMVGADGGVFAFGDAPFDGSSGGQSLAAPVSSVSFTPGSTGYWMVGRDSSLHTFGDAQSRGSGTTTMRPPEYPAAWSPPFVPAVAILSLPEGPETASSGPVRAAAVGDSLGVQEAAYTQLAAPALQMFNGATLGCGVNAGSPMQMYASPTQVSPRIAACAQWSQQFNWVAHLSHANVIMLQSGFWDVQPTLFDGTYVSVDDPGYAEAMAGTLEQAVSILHSAGAQVILDTAPYFADGTPDRVVEDYNQLVRRVAVDDASFVSLLDVNTLVCPSGTFQHEVGGIPVRADNVHLTQYAVTNLIDPTLVPLLNSLAAR